MRLLAGVARTRLTPFWGVELAGYEKNRAKDRKKNEALHAKWRK